jgi:hypothetical protein
MKTFTVIILLILSTFVYSQKLKGRLQGDWVCTEILDAKGNKVPGKFGESNEYLKFTFLRNYLSITEAPFDEGLKILIKYGRDFIDILPEAIYEVPERIYTIKFIDNDNLVLKTKNPDGQPIDYHFVNQKIFVGQLKDDNRIIDNLLVIIKHLKLSKDEKGANRVAEYKIGNEKENLFPCPIFKDYRSATFGGYFSINFVFPNSYQLGSVSDELIVDFEVTDEGAGNIKIVKGLSDEINTSVINIIEGTRKKWEPLKVDEQIIKTTLRIHFIFYLGVSDIPFKFSDK